MKLSFSVELSKSVKPEPPKRVRKPKATPAKKVVKKKQVAYKPPKE